MTDLINRQDAIDALTESNLKRHMDSVKGGEENRSAIRIIVELPSAQRWIPCEERLPEKSDDIVLVTVIEERRVRDIYLMRCDEIETAYIAKWISAWMPLPDPYREEK